MKNQNAKFIAQILSSVAFAAVFCFANQAGAQGQRAENKALLHSPRYLEEHPELLRPWGGELISPNKKSTNLTANSALTKSPRYLEEHPELRWSNLSAHPIVMTDENVSSLTQNNALLHSPRYLEDHPQLLRREPTVEIAPLK